MKKTLLSLLAALSLTTAHADEGMWTLYNLPQAVYETMKQEGYQLPYDKLYQADDAIMKAAQLAGTDDFSVAAYPAKTDWLSQLLAEEKPQHSYIDGQLRQLLGELYEPIMDLRKDEQRNRLQARLPFNVSVK